MLKDSQGDDFTVDLSLSITYIIGNCGPLLAGSLVSQVQVVPPREDQAVVEVEGTSRMMEMMTFTVKYGNYKQQRPL